MRNPTERLHPISKPSWLLLSCLPVVALGVVARPAPAEACTLARVGIQSTFPRDGAVGVPPNAPLLVYGPDIGGSVFILREADGGLVPFEVSPAGPLGLRYLPFQGLEPNTTYELGLRLSEEDREEIVTFTTGEIQRGPQPLPLPPEVEVRLIDTTVAADMCGPRTGICLRGNVPDDGSLEVWVGEDVIAVPGGSSDPVFRAYSTPVRSDECIEVRVRSLAGAVSEPTTFCEGELPRMDIASVGGDWRCASAFAATPSPWHGNPPGAYPGAGNIAGDAGDAVPSGGDVAEPSPMVVEGGCALRPTAAASGASGLLLGLAALLVARQRRRAG